MNIRRATMLTVCLMTFILLGAAAVASAQDNATCAALQNAAFTQAGTLCATTGHGTVCYGHPEVLATFTEATSGGFFTQPGDQADLTITETLTTAPADLSMTPNTWGVALLNVQANLPVDVIENTLGGKGAVYLVSGGVTITNAALNENTVKPLEQGVMVSTQAEADMRKSPAALDTLNSTNVIARIPAETQVSADAVSVDGAWVRVVFNGQPGWISRAVLVPEVDLDDLVALGPDSFTPMQSVTILTDEESSACGMLPSGLFVQGPDEVSIDVRINGVDIRIASTVLFKSGPDGTLEVFVISGLVTLFPDDPERRVVIPPGFKATIRLDDFTLVDGTPEAPYRLMTEEELEEVNEFSEDLPPNILHYVPPEHQQIQASGAGGAIIQVDLSAGDHDGLALARQACADGAIPEEICVILGL